MTVNAEVVKELESMGDARRGEQAVVPPEGLHDLDIEQMWGVRDPVRVIEAGQDELPRGGSEEQLDDGRRIENDHRPSRSERMTSAGDGVSVSP